MIGVRSDRMPGARGSLTPGRLCSGKSRCLALSTATADGRAATPIAADDMTFQRCIVDLQRHIRIARGQATALACIPSRPCRHAGISDFGMISAWHCRQGMPPEGIRARAGIATKDGFGT